MKPMHQVTAFSLLLMALCSCEEQSITRQEPTTATSQASARQSGEGGIIKSGGQPLPSPTVIEQTYVPTNEFFADFRCRTWRITWPTYPAGTNPNLIPTMFSVTNGTPYSFNFLNKTEAANTYKMDFNLYHNNNLASVYDMWSELIHVVDAGEKKEQAYFTKSMHTAAQVETWVKGRPDLFKHYYDYTNDNTTEIENYQKGDIYLFELINKKRYGGVRIVSMTPRIIEVYLAEPNS